MEYDVSSFMTVSSPDIHAVSDLFLPETDEDDGYDMPAQDK
jgi:hypothetical protein